MSRFEDSLRERLREQEAELDPALLTRLAAVRRRALAGAARPWIRVWAPAIGTALLATAVGVAVLMPGSQLQAPTQPSAQREENPEFYRDLDFYLWLAESDMGKHG